MADNLAARMARSEFDADPAAFKARAVAEMLPPAVEAIIAGCKGQAPFKAPQRWAVRAALQISGWLDQRSEVAIVLRLAQDYGLRDEADIRARLELAGKVQSVSLEAAQARSVDLLRRIIAADPGRREAIRAELFGASDANLLPDNAVTE